MAGHPYPRRCWFWAASCAADPGVAVIWATPLCIFGPRWPRMGVAPRVGGSRRLYLAADERALSSVFGLTTFASTVGGLLSGRGLDVSCREQSVEELSVAFEIDSKTRAVDGSSPRPQCCSRRERASVKPFVSCSTTSETRPSAFWTQSLGSSTKPAWTLFHRARSSASSTSAKSGRRRAVSLARHPTAERPISRDR
jgi:hypothetical protein